MENEKELNPYHVRGKKFELKIMKKLKEWGYKKLARTILVNKSMDNKGVDLIGNVPEDKPFLNIQCKASSKRQKYDRLLETMPNNGAVNVLLHEHWWEGSISGTYAILTSSDFEKLLTYNNK